MWHFWMLETENGKMTRQEYKERYLYIFTMTDKIGSSNRSSSRARSHCHRLIQPNKSEVSITAILARKTKFSTTPNSKKVSTNKCDIVGQPEIAMWPSKPEVLISATAWQISLQFRRQTWGFVARASSHKASASDCDIERQYMATKTGNSYTTGTTTHNVEIPTLSPGFSTIASPNKVSPSDCDDDRQPEMAMWPQ